MRKIQLSEFGGPEVLRVADVDPGEIDWVAQSGLSGGGGVHEDFLAPPPIKRPPASMGAWPSHVPVAKKRRLPRKASNPGIGNENRPTSCRLRAGP